VFGGHLTYNALYVLAAFVLSSGLQGSTNSFY